MNPLLLTPLLPLVFQIAMFRQTCRRAEPSAAYMCTSDEARSNEVKLILEPVTPSPIEREAYAGISPETGMGWPNGGQYLPRVQVRKSVGVGDDAAPIYTIRFKTFQFFGVGQPTVYETVFISSPTLNLSEPILLQGDREEPDPLRFRQVFFALSLISGAQGS
jgi:hypothetical protein